MLRNLRLISLISLSMLAVLSTMAQAEEKNWNFSVGGGVMYGPAYEGSDKYVAIPLPDISVEYKNGLFFANVWDGIGSYPLQGENYKVGMSIGLALGRDEDDDIDNLRGMGDIDMGAAANLMGEYDFGFAKLSGKISKGTEDYGTTATVELGKHFSVTEKLMLMGSVGLTWADADHMNSYFGVSSAQSARSGYSRYDAESGVKSVGFTVGAFYNMTEHWDAKLMVKGDQLLGDAADSPITKEDFNPSVILTTSYKF